MHANRFDSLRSADDDELSDAPADEANSFVRVAVLSSEALNSQPLSPMNQGVQQ